MHIKKFNDSQLHFISKMIDIGYNNKIILVLFKKEFNVETISTYITQVRRGHQGKDISQNYKFAIDGNYPTYYEWVEYLIENDIYYGTKFEEFGNYIKNKIEEDNLFLITKSNTFKLIAYLQETDNGFKIVKSIDDKVIDEKFTHDVEIKVDNMNKVNLENKNSYILLNIDISDKYMVLMYILLYSIKGIDSIINYHLYNDKN
ncbi:hypothetical protein UFVDC4_00151 [Staphylococcus phage vB_SauM-UFV_DC4]|nr:hypothetical protein UFVDC4_00151 [Staphylococcus phage vB_SauM-UFV_DC4]